MPEISRFYGLVIAMYYNDHKPPHFHVRYGEKRGIIEIDGPSMLAGDLPPRALSLALEWAELRRVELTANWELARQLAPLNKITPLE